MSWEPVIGLEIHIHLKTRTKMFCRCEVTYSEPENTRTCPVCLAHPGSLPVPNAKAVEWTIKLGLALECRIAEHAVFHRKNYFYPDNPKGYQISQYDEPLCLDGRLVVPGSEGVSEVGIVRAHLEEDAAKNVHLGTAQGRIAGASATLVDFNRAGTPLVEIVTQPDLRSADQARRFLQLLRQTVVELGISDAEMEKGSLRFDVNVSVRPEGSDELRTRTELKNLNSFAFAARAIEREVERQIAVYESGGQVDQETLHFEPGSESAPLRSKEEAQDYRYLPEPDLVPIEPPTELVERVRAELPELPGARVLRLAADLEHDLALDLVTSGRDALYERVPGDRRAVANVLMNQFAAAGVDPAAVNAEELGKLIEARSRIPRDRLTEALAASGDPGFSAETYLGDGLVGDTSELAPIVDRILEANPGQVESYRGGKEGLLGFFVGQVMRETQGKADPKIVNELLREKLSA
jgi:aspartyl-tRNA(Asn)/glutamyl-tRNA(Gln) amidotransferase subunit B